MTTYAGFQPNPVTAPHLVAVLAFDGVVLGDLSIPLEIFGRVRNAQGHACYEVQVCAEYEEVQSEHLNLVVPYGLSSVAQAKTVIVPGLDRLDRPISPAVLRALQAASQRGARIASICTGAFVLARTGLLDGLRATTHWRAAAGLAHLHPKIEVNPDVLYVDNGRILTSAGAAAGMDLCLHMIRSDFGASVAARVARAAVMPLERSGGQAQFIEYQPPQAIESLGPLLAWIEEHLDEELSLASIARQAHLSQRTLSRRFRQQVGLSPAQWIARARIRRAQQLLESSALSIEQVAAETGFRSASVLREHFGSTVGTTPTAYRRSFATSSQTT